MTKYSLFRFHWLAFLIVLSGCKDKENLSTIDALNNSAQFVDQKNLADIHRLQEHIQESGNRQADMELLEDLASLTPLFEKAHYIESMQQGVEQLEVIIDQTDWIKPTVLAKDLQTVDIALDRYITTRDTIDHLVYVLNLMLLKSDIIKDKLNRVGFQIFDSGIAWMYNQSDTLLLNKPFKSVITLAEPFSKDLVRLDQPIIKLTGSSGKITDFELEYMGRGGWIFSFIPHTKEMIQFEFSVIARSPDQSSHWGFPFDLNKQFFVIE